MTHPLNPIYEYHWLAINHTTVQLRYVCIGIPRWREAIQSLSWLVGVAFHVAKYDLNYLQCFVMMENEAPDWQGGGKKCVVCEANKQPAQL